MAATDAYVNGQVAAERAVSDAKVESKAPAAADTASADVAAADVKAGEAAKEGEEIKKWPGWPGDNVFRMVVPVVKVGSIIGKKGELIKKICEETRAKIRVLDGVTGTTDRVVLVYGKEEPEAEISPAMEAVLRVFKRVFDIGADGTAQAASTPAICSVRLLVPSMQAINLIGKQGSSIKSIQESTGATIRVLTGDELPFYATPDERVVDIQGETLKVLKALEAVVGHLRKFLVDHSVVPLFEKSPNAPPAPAPAQERAPDPWSDRAQSLIHTAQQSGIGSDYTLPLKRDSLFLERESQLDSQISRPSLFRPEPLSSLRSTGLGRGVGALVTQVTQTMQIPLSYAEDIIGVGGSNIAYIRRTSGAVLTVQESGGYNDEIIVEIKGTSTQVQAAQQLIQDFIEGHKEPALSSHGGIDTGLRSSYPSHLPSSTYSSSASYNGGYGGSSGLGGYSSYRF